jgi:hypothetical protein
MVYSRVERVLILEYYFASTSLPAVREAFNNACPDKGVPNDTTVQKMLTKFWYTKKCFCATLASSSYKTAEITALPISSSASFAKK